MSKLHHGRNGAELRVHEASEKRMIDRHRAEIVSGLGAALESTPQPPSVTTESVAAATMRLMTATLERLEPKRICEVYAVTGGDPDDMWQNLGVDTVRCIADACQSLAVFWSSAWNEAEVLPPTPDELPHSAIRRIYEQRSFAPSYFLPEIAC